jgi:hypothetical protein
MDVLQPNFNEQLQWLYSPLHICNPMHPVASPALKNEKQTSVGIRMHFHVQRLRGIGGRQPDEHYAGHRAVDYGPALESNSNRRRYGHVHGYGNGHGAIVVSMAERRIGHQRRHIPGLYDRDIVGR